ncbi:MAG: cytidine deaminase, partial [Clostridia bacterium]|nr:cytidine deaminase [Clostridia bacterium]
AKAARERAYAPYSRFLVGAAIRAPSGAIYVGCNVENVSFGAALCAERAAVCAAVAAGERSYTALAVTAGGSHVTPCGICRQVLSEFSRDGKLVVICGTDGGYKTFELETLLPEAFAQFEPEVKKSE